MPRSKKIVYKKYESSCLEPVKKERNEDSTYATKQAEVSSYCASSAVPAASTNEQVLMPCSKKIVYKKYESSYVEPVKKERNEDSTYATKQAEVSSYCASSAVPAASTNEQVCFSDLKKRTFHIVHVNWFCATDDNIYYPAEIALLEFSLESGIKTTYHTLINSGPPPVGFAYEIKTHVGETHGIPLETGEEDYCKILDVIRKFVKKDENSKELLPLYTMPDQSGHNFSLTAVKSTLLTLCEVAGCPEEYDNFQVHSLSELFFDMKNMCSMELDGINAFVKLQTAEFELQKDTYTYSQWISCLFHHENGKNEYCSLALVHRWVYIICENLCQDLRIQMLEGKHKPLQSVTRTFYNSATTKSGRRNNDRINSRQKSKTYNKDTELQNRLPATLDKLTIAEDSQYINDTKEVSLKTESPEHLVDLSRNNYRPEEKKKTAAGVVSGIKYYPQFSDCSFPAIGSGKKSNRHGGKW